MLGSRAGDVTCQRPPSKLLAEPGEDQGQAQHTTHNFISGMEQSTDLFHRTRSDTVCSLLSGVHGLRYLGASALSTSTSHSCQVGESHRKSF